MPLRRNKLNSDVVGAHKHSSSPRQEILASDICGCFYCEEIYSPSKIEEWIDEGECALCPVCNIDSVIGSKSGYPITKEFLRSMNQHWF